MQKPAKDTWLFASACLLAGFVAYWQISYTGQFDWPQLFGDKQISMLDLWSFQHLMSGVLIGATLRWLAPDFSASKLRFISAVMLLSYGWEALELQLELGTFGHCISEWKVGFEHWSNRLVGDPLLGIIGALIARRYRQAWKFVLIPAAFWLAINVLSPTSMEIQKIILGDQ